MTLSLGNLGRSEEALLFSASLNLMIRTVDMRNGPLQVTLGESIGRKIMGEFCFAAIVVASLVEAVFRMILAIPGALILYVDPDGLTDEHKKIILSATIAGMAISAVNTVVAIVALFENISFRRFGYDEILPCVTSCVAHARPMLAVGERYLRGQASIADVMMAVHASRRAS